MGGREDDHVRPDAPIRVAAVRAIGIDPGTQSTGICMVSLRDGKLAIDHMATVRGGKGRFAKDRLTSMVVGMSDVLSWMLATMEDATVVIEGQKFRPGRERDPNAIMAVQLIAGAAVGLVADCADRLLVPTPAEWRGTQKKPIVQKWILKAATEAGLEVPAKASADAIDALGLALWGLGRFKV